MSDQAKKLRSIINQQNKINSILTDEMEPKKKMLSNFIDESSKLLQDNEDLSIVDPVKDSIQTENRVEIETKIPLVENDSLHRPCLENRRNVGVLVIASENLMSKNHSFIFNLGLHLQYAKNRVCIIDIDGSLVDSLNYDNKGKGTLTDVINQKVPLSEVIINGPEQMKLIKSGDFKFNHHLTKKEFLKPFEQCDDIDLIMIYTGMELERLTLISLILAEEIILISESNLNSIKNAYSLLKLINQYQIKPVVRLLLEHTSSLGEAQKGFYLLWELTNQFLDLQISSLGSVNLDMFCTLDQEPILLNEEIQCLANELYSLPLMKSKYRTIEAIIYKIVKLCS